MCRVHKYFGKTAKPLQRIRNTLSYRFLLTDRTHTHKPYTLPKAKFTHKYKLPIRTYTITGMENWQGFLVCHTDRNAMSFRVVGWVSSCALRELRQFTLVLCVFYKLDATFGFNLWLGTHPASRWWSLFLSLFKLTLTQWPSRCFPILFEQTEKR